jgi:putative Ca2+/H+ antiporter (TMEM165/GDT1 family)
VHGWPLFVSVFGVIFVAELPDKTALAALVLATRHRPLAVVLGSGLALTVQSAVAVAAGQLVSLLPERPVRALAGLLFVVSAVVMWRRHEEADDGNGNGEEKDKEKDKENEKEKEEKSGDATFWRSFGIVFLVVFVAEWGDLTQLATAALAARWRSPFVVFAGSTCALWAVAAIATFVGHKAAKLLDPERTKRVAAVVFGVVGLVLLLGAAGVF